jgi:hypothetical protein
VGLWAANLLQLSASVGLQGTISLLVNYQQLTNLQATGDSLRIVKHNASISHSTGIGSEDGNHIPTDRPLLASNALMPANARQCWKWARIDGRPSAEVIALWGLGVWGPLLLAELRNDHRQRFVHRPVT